MFKGSRKSKADEPTVIVIDPGASHNDENKAVIDPGDERMVYRDILARTRPLLIMLSGT